MGIHINFELCDFFVYELKNVREIFSFGFVLASLPRYSVRFQKKDRGLAFLMFRACEK